MSPRQTLAPGHVLPEWVGQSLVSEAKLSATLVQYRGYLHEVNNALAGIGTLLEALQGADADTLQANLGLMTSAAQKATLLERRLRMLTAETTGNELTSGLVLEDFLAQNRDLMAMMLQRGQRLTMDTGQQHSVMILPASILWSLITVALYWARLKKSREISVRVIRASNSVALSIELGAEVEGDVDDVVGLERLETAMELLAQRHEVGFVGSRGAALFALGKYLAAI